MKFKTSNQITPIKERKVQLAKPASAPSTVLFGDALPAALLIVDSLCFPNFLPIKYAPTSTEQEWRKQ